MRNQSSRQIKLTQGFTYPEVLLAIAISVLLFTSLLAVFTVVKSVNKMAQHNMEAMQVVRNRMELLKATAFANITASQQQMAYDAGVDGVFGTADDLNGTLTVALQDFLDMDGDGNTAEAAIDVDGNGGNDATAAVPVRVTFTWSEHLLGQDKNLSAFADTLIAA